MLELDANFFGDEMKDEFLEQLNAYADGELSEKDRQRVEEHLAACPECRAAYEEILELKALMGEAKTPQGLSARWRQAAARSQERKARGRRMVRTVASLAAVACVGILCFRAMPWWSGDQPTDQPASPALEAREETEGDSTDAVSRAAEQESMLQDSAEEKNALSALQKQDGAVLAMEEDDAMDMVADLGLKKATREDNVLSLSLSQEEGQRVLAWLNDRGYHLGCQGPPLYLTITLQ